MTEVNEGTSPQLLLITGLWPTPDAPQAGIFVKRRVANFPIRVIAPRSYGGPLLLRYLRLAIASLLARGSFQGVEAHPLFPAGLIGLVVARVRRVPLVTYAHGADVRETANQNALYLFLARQVVRGSSAVVTNSSDTAAHVTRLRGQAIVIPPGVDVHKFRPSARPNGRPVLYLGGTDPRKGYRVAAGLATTLLGPGIKIVDPDDIPGLLAQHDILLVPSVAEPFGLVAAEAIASGRWVVARDVGGLRDIVEDGVTGTLVSQDAEFPTAIAQVPDYDPAAVAAHADRFSLSAANERLNSLWRTLVDNPAPPEP